MVRVIGMPSPVKSMEHIDRSRDPDTLSTVTDLISTSKIHQKSVAKESHKQKRQKSCSSRLERYIKNYEKRQTRDLAEMLTRHVPVQSVGEENKENELQKEITLARSLFSNSAVKTTSDNLQSLSTDDLLTMDPQSVAGFQKNQYPTLPNHGVLSMRQPVMYSTPHKENTYSNSSKPSPMRFSEIATTLRSEFDDVFGTDTSTDLTESQSNLFTLNGSTYTPHKDKYKSMWKEIDETQHSVKTLETINSDIHDLTNSTPSKTLTIDAGRTPYRSHSHSRIITTNTFDGNLETSPQSSASLSHYSVPFEFKGRADIIDFMKDCLDNDCSIATEINKGSGSVETLKNMLFTLQSVSVEEDEEAAKGSDVAENSVKDGHSSLKLAISHLSNLQHLLT